MHLSGEYETVYQDFLEYQKRRTTKAGFVTLRKTTRYFLAWLEAEKIAPDKAVFHDCLRYRDFVSSRLKADGTELSIGTLHTRITAGKALCRFLVETDRCTENPFAEVSYPRSPRLVRRNALSQPEMRTLLEYFSRYHEEKTRREQINRYWLHVVCEFLYATGLRVFEAAALRAEDVHTDEQWVYIAQGKGNRSRIAFMTKFASDITRLYIEKSRPMLIRKRYQENGLFGVREQRFIEKLNQALRVSCGKLRIPVITSHGFRHSLGTHLLRNGADIRYIQAVLGHRRLTSTQVYAEVDRETLRDCIDLFHPRSGGCHDH
jgi:integrase/recombinase XerD